METVAFTIVASNNVNGSTMHSARHISVSRKDGKMNNDAINRLKSTYLIIIDEISITDSNLISRLQRATRKISNLILSTTSLYLAESVHFEFIKYYSFFANQLCDRKMFQFFS